MSEEPTRGPGPQAHGPSERPIPILRRLAVVWRHLDAPGFQLASFSEIPDGHVVEGRVITVFDDQPAEVHFAIMCGPDWRTRHASAAVMQGMTSSTIEIRRDDEEHWWIARGTTPRSGRPDEERLPELDGVLDVDFGISPATNTLPIRRLALAVGEARDSDALWVGFPGLEVERLPQRYTREGENTYGYESSGGAFTARLDVDEHGVIVRYGNLWERVADSITGAAVDLRDPRSSSG